MKIVLMLVFISNFSLACKIVKTEGDFTNKVFTSSDSFTDYLNFSMLEMHNKMDEAITNDRVEKVYLRAMIPHHQGAVEMSKAIILKTKDKRLQNIAMQIIISQENEIKYMKLLLNELK